MLFAFMALHQPKTALSLLYNINMYFQEFPIIRVSDEGLLAHLSVRDAYRRPLSFPDVRYLLIKFLIRHTKTTFFK